MAPENLLNTFPGRLHKFDLPEGMDAYNPTVPFNYKGREIIAARVEQSNNELTSIVAFFSHDDECTWRRISNLPEFTMQDPFITRIGRKYVLGGVEVTVDPGSKRIVDYTTVLYVGNSLETLEPFYRGPKRMKGIRLLELQDGKIAVFTRPQVVSEKDPYGRGRIAFSLIDSLDGLTAGVTSAQIIDGLYKDEEWGGCNEIHELENGNIGVLGHHAYYDEDHMKHYYTVAFEFDPVCRQIIQYKVVVKREAFPVSVRAKREDLYNVLYTGGIRKKQHDDSKYELFVGISDTSVGSIEIESPFSSNPKLNMHTL